MPLREGHLSILWPLLPVLVAISLWFGVKAGGDNLLRNTTAQSGIDSLARAGSVAQAEWIIASWNQRAPDRRSQIEIDNQSWLARVLANGGRMRTEIALRSLVFDLFFIIFYTVSMAVACVLAATEIALRSRRKKPRLVAFGIYLAFLQVLTAGLDVIENVALWRMLRGAVSNPSAVTNPWPWIAYAASMGKYVLLGVSLFYIFLAFGFWAVDHQRPARQPLRART